MFQILTPEPPQGSLEGTLTTAFGVPDVSLGYAVIDQEVYGTRIARFVLRCVMYLGSSPLPAKFPAEADLLPGAENQFPSSGESLLKGAAVAGLDPETPEEDFAVAEAEQGVPLSRVFAFAGVATQLRQISEATVAKGGHMAMSLTRHQWGGAGGVFLIPGGFSGDVEAIGLLGHAGETRCVWAADPLGGDAGEGAAMDCLLARETIQWGGLELRQSKWALLRVRGGANGGAKITAKVGVWGLQGNVVMSVSTSGYRFALSGRVHGGVPFAADVTSRGGPGTGLVRARWTLTGWVPPRGLAEIQERGRATYVRRCREDVYR